MNEKNRWLPREDFDRIIAPTGFIHEIFDKAYGAKRDHNNYVKKAKDNLDKIESMIIASR